MNTSANNPNALAKTLAAALVLAVVGALIIASRLTPSSAALQERVFENKIPAHIPIKIKIKKEKEKSFKDLKNEKWLREFELEVTNTGDRPIYFLSITMGTNVKVETGLEMAYPLWYGRAQLGDIVTKATSDDVPISPGETIILQVGEVPLWEQGVREGRWPESTKFTADFQSLSFGDGTGYFGTKLYPPPERRKAAVNLPQSPKARERPGERPNGKLSQQSNAYPTFKQPTFMSAKFLSAEEVITAAPSATQPVVTCQFPQCTAVVPWNGYVCYDNQQRPVCRLQNRPTPDSLNGVCKELEVRTTECSAGTVQYFCQIIDVYECGFGSAPTPPPTPSPSPQPCTYCTDPNAVGPADCSNPSQPKCDPFSFEYAENGCCYRQTCERAGISPPPPQPCEEGYFRSSNILRPFPLCDYAPCIPIPQPAPTPCAPEFDGGTLDSCECYPNDPNCVSPILIDISGNGFRLTDADAGINFDMRANGSPLRIAWTTPNSDDAWLALDRNGNGTIDNGQELFGNFTPQPVPMTGQERNGFLALAEYDKSNNGGNGDGVISPTDTVFTSLRLWQDFNHNGFSEASELRTLQALGLKRLELDYKLSKATDEFGNRFRYRAKVQDEQGAKVSRWAWDVFLVVR